MNQKQFPLLFDIQINGFNGVDFSQADLTVDDVIHVQRSLLQEGIAYFLPTLVTNSEVALSRNLQIIAQACAEDRFCAHAIRGIHLEGPFLSAEAGFAGAHPKEWMLDPDISLFERLQEASRNKITLLTLAPERKGSVEFIQYLFSQGVRVAIGHSNANDADIRQATVAGASLSTHLGNGMAPMLRRHPNPLWSQLANDDLFVSLIIDGFHLPKEFVQVCLRQKPQQAILISDATKFAHMPPGNYQSHIGGQITLSQDKRLFMQATPELLAGSAKSLLDVVWQTKAWGLADLEEAWQMASEIPAQYMGENKLLENMKNKADYLEFTWHEDGFEITKLVFWGETIDIEKSR